MVNDGVLTVLGYSALAAVVAALGAVPFSLGRDPRPVWIGGAYAVAGGVMLGAGHLLILQGLERAPVHAVLGLAVGVAYTAWTRSYAGLEELDTEPEGPLSAPEAYKSLLQSFLHSVPEGMAIGAAMLVQPRFGILLALTFALHNVAEAMALTEQLRRTGMSAGESAGLAVTSRAGQPLLAVATYAVVPELPGALPGALGFTCGALLFLVLTELVPASYRRAGKRTVALLLGGAAALVVLVEELLA